MLSTLEQKFKFWTDCRNNWLSGCVCSFENLVTNTSFWSKNAFVWNAKFNLAEWKYQKWGNQFYLYMWKWIVLTLWLQDIVTCSRCVICSWERLYCLNRLIFQVDICAKCFLLVSLISILNTHETVRVAIGHIGSPLHHACAIPCFYLAVGPACKEERWQNGSHQISNLNKSHTRWKFFHFPCASKIYSNNGKIVKLVNAPLNPLYNQSFNFSRTEYHLESPRFNF